MMTLSIIRECVCPSPGNVTIETRRQLLDAGIHVSHDDVIAANKTATSSPLCAGWNDINTTLTDRYERTTAQQRWLHRVEDALYTRVVVAVCFIGLVGNAASLAVLVAQQAASATSGGPGVGGGLGRMQRFACLGLTALAVSDALFCLSVIPHGFVERDPFWFDADFALYYAAYGEALINVFVCCSTWLTVGLAVGRYLAVCFPFRARALIGLTVARRYIAGVVVVGVAVNVPRFFWNNVVRMRCGAAAFYFRWPGALHLANRPRAERAYFWCYATAAMFLPLALLVVSSVNLIRKLRTVQMSSPATTSLLAGVSSSSARRRGGGGGRTCSPSIARTESMVTRTLATVAVMHIVLVTPAELLTFARQSLVGGGGVDGRTSSQAPTLHHGASASDVFGGDSGGGDGISTHDVYNFLAAVLNTLQAVNFAFNFLLYCTVNASFRRTVVVAVCCRRRRVGGALFAEVPGRGSRSSRPSRRGDGRRRGCVCCCCCWFCWPCRWRREATERQMSRRTLMTAAGGLCLETMPLSSLQHHQQLEQQQQQQQRHVTVGDDDIDCNGCSD